MDFVKIASITTTGSASNATGDSGVVSTSANGGSLPSGFLVEIFIDFTSMPSSTDVTISEVLPNGALRTLLVTTNTNTDGVYPVKIASYSSAGVASTSDLVYPNVGSRFQVTVAQADALTAGVVVYMKIIPDSGR